MYKKIFNIKNTIIIIILCVSFNVITFASSPSPEPVEAMDTNIVVTETEVATHTENTTAEQDEFRLDFDWDNIGVMHNEYHLPVSGYKIALMGISVVFISLIIISIIFTLLGKVMLFLQAKRAKEAGGESSKNITYDNVAYSDEINAAIAMALHLYLEEHHDEESGVLTINKIERRYSPWSSKIYNINQKPF